MVSKKLRSGRIRVETINKYNFQTQVIARKGLTSLEEILINITRADVKVSMQCEIIIIVNFLLCANFQNPGFLYMFKFIDE